MSWNAKVLDPSLTMPEIRFVLVDTEVLDQLLSIGWKTAADLQRYKHEIKGFTGEPSALGGSTGPR